MLDGQPIVMIGTGFGNRSANSKTGDMIQTWILRQDLHPVDAIQTNADASICGSCPLRGTGGGRDRACYVNPIVHGPSQVWKSYRSGRYRPIPELRLFSGRAVRLGSYGDPAAVPVDVVERIVRNSTGHTGYTHQWRTCDQRLREFCMASADNVDDYYAAKDLGWRVYRVRPSGDTTRLSGEAICPASAQQGFKLTCAQCMACCGTSGGRRGDIVICAHGSAAVTKNFDKRFKGIPVKAAA